MRIQLGDLTREIFPTQLFDIIFQNSMIERIDLYQKMHMELGQEIPQKKVFSSLFQGKREKKKKKHFFLTFPFLNPIFFQFESQLF